MSRCLVSTLLLIAITLANVEFGLTMEAGFAERDITPPVGAERPGGYSKNFHRIFHDPCKVRAAVFADEHSRVAIVGIDALLVRNNVTRPVRQRIEERCGLPGHAIMVAASHSHSAGPMGMILPGEYDHASEFIQSLAYQQSSMADATYLKRVEDAIVEAVCDANSRCTEAKCNVGLGKADEISFNRRYRMRNGDTHTYPRQGNPEIVERVGTNDPDVGVVGAWGLEGKLMGCIVNFACHCTTAPGGISADYVYYLEQTIRGTFGEQVIVVFVNGASGDITQQDDLSPFEQPIREESSRLVGATIGAEAIKALLKNYSSELSPIAAKQTILKIPRRRPSPERVKRCLDIVGRNPAAGDDTDRVFAKEVLLLDARLQKEPVADVEVQAIQLGPAIFLSNPSEYFCQYGLEIKAHSPFPFTFPVSLANDCVGYVPTEEAFAPGGGGYETRLTSYSNLIPSAGRSIADECIELANSLEPGRRPIPPPAPAFKGIPWSYGNVPPELD